MGILNPAYKAGLISELSNKLYRIVSKHFNVFRVSFSSCPPARLPPLHIDLLKEYSPERVKLRNYYPEQRKFTENMISSLVRAGLAYPNPTERWEAATLLVPKSGPQKWRFMG